jgi:uncharacterized phage protein (TIGR01671 family)
MREILFRGIWVHGNKEWIEGDLVRDSEGKPHIVDSKYVDYWCGDPIFVCEDECEVIPETVGQYTGLLDKDGKKIWEGDIVRTLAPCCLDKYIVGLVMFGDYSSSYQSSNVGYYVDWSLNKNIAMYCKMGDIEVIGNVFDNAEMLEVK